MGRDLKDVQDVEEEMRGNEGRVGGMVVDHTSGEYVKRSPAGLPEAEPMDSFSISMIRSHRWSDGGQSWQRTHL